MPDQVNEILYTFHTVWEWTVDQIEEILTLSKTVEDEHQVKIQHIPIKNTFEIIGIGHDSINKAQDDFSKILMDKSSEAKTVLTVPPREKKPSKFDQSQLVVGLPPPFPHHDPVKRIFKEKEIEDVEGLDDYFYFSNGVDDPSKVLSWHNREANNIPCDYWKDICKECNVTGDVILDNRKIHVTGGKREDVEKAIHRLKTLEQIYLRPDFIPKRVPLVHYPKQDVHFKLYFLPLKDHGYFKMTVKSHTDLNVYLLMPAILDPITGKYKISRSHKTDSTNASDADNISNVIKKTPQQSPINKSAVPSNNDNIDNSSYFFPSPPTSASITTTLPPSVLSTMSASIKGKNKVVVTQNSYDFRSVPPSSTNSEIYNWPQNPLPQETYWDNNGFEQNSQPHFPPLSITSSSQFIDNTARRDFNNNNNKPSNWSISELRKQRSQYTEANTTSQPSSSSGPILWDTKTQDTNIQISKESRRRTDTFDERPHKDDMVYKTKKIVLQKSPELTHPSNQSNITPGKMLRDYNFVRTKEALVEGMEHVRAFRGEIRFSGRLGKVLFSDVPPQVSTKFWEFYELKEITKEKLVRTNFTEIATHEEILYNGFTEILGNKAHYTNQYFEIDADARNAPYGEYIPVTMYINMSYVSLEKVMMKWNRVADVEWSVLDRKSDFIMSISTRKALRHDVKPFNTFIKKASVSPTTRIITFEDVPKFLEVKQVRNVTVNKYQLHFPFIAEVNRIEILPLNSQKNSKKIQGKTGYGILYYTIEIYNSNHREMFSKNQKLATGTIASWTVCDVLGKDPAYINMVEFIKTMLLLVERCNKVADDKLKELLDEFKKNS